MDDLAGIAPVFGPPGGLGWFLLSEAKCKNNLLLAEDADSSGGDGID